MFVCAIIYAANLRVAPTLSMRIHIRGCQWQNALSCNTWSIAFPDENGQLQRLLTATCCSSAWHIQILRSGCEQKAVSIQYMQTTEIQVCVAAIYVLWCIIINLQY